MTTKSITIGPEKFTIFDSDVSDSESEAEEWVSVSTSTTISTTSTLPPHLNLNPRSAIKTRPPIPESRMPQTYKSNAASSPASPPSPPPPPPLPSIMTMTMSNGRSTPPTQPSAPAITTQPSTPQEPPVTILKRFFPTLTAIYIVSPTSISRSTFTSTTHDPNNPNIYAPLSTLTTSYPNPPISTKATRPSSNLVETYIRICADCAKPPMTIYCDGTWTSPPVSTVTKSPCPTHLPAFQVNTPNYLTCQPDARDLTCGKCTHMANVINCLDCARKRDGTLFHAVLDAVSPFRRVETESLGVGVFDMSVPVSGEVYRHVQGCGCVR